MFMRHFVFLFVFGLCLCACGDSRDESLPDVSGELVNLEIAVPAVSGFADANPDTRADGGSADRTVVAQTSIDVGDGIVLDAVLEQAKPAPATRATGTLPDGVYFRVVAYLGSVSVSNYVKHIDYRMTGGKAVLQTTGVGPAALYPGTYQFVCYSYGQTTAISDGFNGSSLVLPSSAIDGKDFLYYRESKTLSKASPSININFAHMCSRMQMELNTADAGTLTSFSNPASLTGTFATSPAMTLGGSALSAGSGSRTYTFTIPSSEWSKEVAVSGYNLVAPCAPGSVRLTIPSMTLDVWGEVKTMTNQSVTYSGVQLTAGNTYFFRVSLTSIILPNFTVTAGGKTWRFTRGNLIYNPNKSTRNWYINTSGRSMQGYCTDTYGEDGEYMEFRWNTLVPDDWRNVGPYSLATDPCTKLGSGWVTPSADVLRRLVEAGSCWGSYTMSTGGTEPGYWFGTTSVPSTANQDRYLFLPARTTGYTGLGHYWTSTGLNDFNSSYLSFSISLVVVLNSLISAGNNVRCVSSM